MIFQISERVGFLAQDTIITCDLSPGKGPTAIEIPIPAPALGGAKCLKLTMDSVLSSAEMLLSNPLGRSDILNNQVTPYLL